MTYKHSHTRGASPCRSAMAQFCVHSTVTVEVSRDELSKFRRRALRQFPCEMLAYLIGFVEKPAGKIKRIVVSRFDYPECEASPYSVSVMPGEVERVQDQLQAGESIVGSIHSHPWTKDEPEHYDPNPSTMDIENAAETGELVYLIYNICEAAGQSKRTTKMGVFLGTPKTRLSIV